MERIHEITPDVHDLVTNSYEHYLKDQLLSVTIRWDCWGAKLDIMDIADAMKSGKECQGVHIQFKNTEHDDDEGFHAMHAFLDKYGKDLRRCLADALALPWVKSTYGWNQIFDGNRVLTRCNETAKRVYSPFATLNPLTEAPGKWTVAHVVRALWNGQFTALKCTGRYTDDYAGDAASDFGKRAIENARAFCKKLIESPRGWRAYASGAEVSVNCYSFDYNSFLLKLN